MLFVIIKMVRPDTCAGCSDINMKQETMSMSQLKYDISKDNLQITERMNDIYTLHPQEKVAGFNNIATSTRFLYYRSKCTVTTQSGRMKSLERYQQQEVSFLTRTFISNFQTSIAWYPQDCKVEEEESSWHQNQLTGSRNLTWTL